MYTCTLYSLLTFQVLNKTLPSFFDSKRKIWKKRRVPEFGIDMYTLLHLKWITNKDLLYSIGNYIQYLVITYNEKNLKKIYIYKLNHFAVHLKLSQH